MNESSESFLNKKGIPASMRIALVNKDLDSDEYRQPAENIMLTWRRMLSGKGHTIDSGSSLDALPRPLRDYDLALAHPTWNDFMEMAVEMEDRREFKAIIYTSHPARLDCPRVGDIRESAQLYFTTNDTLVTKLIEEGW
jgi:hypothetical protein